MKTYILLDGPSSTINGLTYAPGEAVNSNHDLVKLFPNRFKLAPAGIEGTRWPKEVNDVSGEGAFAVIGNRDLSTFRIVGKDNKKIAGCEVMSLADATAKYKELAGVKAEKPAKVEKAPVKKQEEETDESDESEDEEESEEAEEETDEEESDDEEEEEEEKPAKKSKKSEKSGKKSKKNR